MKNTLQDLNNHLFEQLERLNDEDLTDEQLDRELRRAEGMSKIAPRSSRTASSPFKTHGPHGRVRLQQRPPAGPRHAGGPHKGGGLNEEGVEVSG